MSTEINEKIKKLEQEINAYEKVIINYKELIKLHRIEKKKRKAEAQHPFSEGSIYISKNEQKELNKIEEEISHIELLVHNSEAAIRTIRKEIQRKVDKLLDQKIKKIKEKYQKKKSIRVRIRRKEKTFQKDSFTVVRFTADISHINGHISLNDYYKEGDLAFSHRNAPSGNQYLLKGKIVSLFNRSVEIDCYFSRLLSPNLYPGDWFKLAKGVKFSLTQYQKEVNTWNEKEKKYLKKKEQAQKISPEQERELKDRK